MPPVVREGLAARTPNLFDFAKVTRRDSSAPIRVAYWSAQLASVFESDDAHRAVDSFVTLETLVGHPVADEDEVIALGVDRLLEAHVRAHVAELASSAPFFLTVHLAATHAPYFVDEANAPYRPYSNVVRWSGMDELRNAYMNSLLEQDVRVAGIVEAFLGAQAGAPWVIVFTSDHGEAFGEHHAIHHGQNLFDEQLRVPLFVARGGGAFGPGEDAGLEANRSAPLTHLDLVPTLLDALGVLDDPMLAAPRRLFYGRSLLRPPPALASEPAAKAIPISNCTSLFPCPVPTWGMLDGSWKLEAQAWDADFSCFEAVARGGEERRVEDLDVRCRRMREASRAFFPALPNGRPNR